MAEKLEDPKNLCPASAAWLREAGIAVPTALRLRDALVVCLTACAHGHRPSVNLLYAMQGAVVDQHWSRVDKGWLLPSLDQAEQESPIPD
ncbi:MAG: TfoX/Sxy family DNA transformation protein [Gammaproteobacteria bacterium]